MTKIKITCQQCGLKTEKESGAVNRSKKIGAPLYCSRECSGIARRVELTVCQKKEAKRLYDIEYREKNKSSIKIKKRKYFLRTYDPEKARINRKLNMPRHIQYCRTEKYRKWKREYDEKHLAKKQYGEFSECIIVLRRLEDCVLDRCSRYELDMINGKLNKRKRRNNNAGTYSF